MTCSRRHQSLSLDEALHMPRGEVSRCSECGRWIHVGAPMRRRGSSLWFAHAMLWLGLVLVVAAAGLTLGWVLREALFQ